MTSTETGSDAVAETSLDIDFVSAQLNRTVAIVGSSMAVFTFLLFFLFPRYVNNEINPFLFQGTLAAIVLVIFSLAFSGFCYFGICASTNSAEKRILFRRGNLLYFVGLELVTIEPTMILFTIGLDIVALMALVLFFVFAFFVARQFWRLGRSVRDTPELNL